jgi:hypothetical protein
MFRRQIAYITVLIFVLAGCGTVPIGGTDVNNTSNIPVHVKPMETRAYTGNRGAIIFSINHLEEKSLRNVVDRIIRVFAEYELPVDVAISVPRTEKDREYLSFLVPYSDAGVIDVNLDGSDISWLDADTSNSESASIPLKSLLDRDAGFISNYFGSYPSTCVFPYEQFNEHNYRILQETGFNIVSAKETGDFTASRQPVNWAGQVDKKGLYRLPVVVEVNYPGINPMVEANTAAPPDGNKKIVGSISSSVKGFGLAVVSIQPRSFVGADGKADIAKIQQLANLIKQCSSYGEIVTYNGWLKYATSYIGIQQSKPRVLPIYKGGPAVIFRLDDVTKGWYEDTVKALIELYKSNGVPLDCGVVSNANGIDSYDMPWLKKYYDEGSVGISLHGFDWTYYQLDTTKSGLTFEQIKFKLQKARDLYLNYYGASPVAITVPTDYFDKSGYQAIEESGFKIFSTQISQDPYPSAVPVDFDGRKDPQGMYRLATATDVCDWDQKNGRFTDPWDISKVVATKDYCKYYSGLSSTMTDDFFGYQVCREMGLLNVAVIGVHPTAFIDSNGKTDHAKLQKLDTIIKWCKTNGTVTTFEQWYNYNALK